jgi:hypothetical protein
VKFCWNFRVQLPENFLANWQLLHHDNARPHTARATQERIQELKCELLEHPPYSPDLSPRDFHLSASLKNPLRWQMLRWWQCGWNGSGREQSKNFNIAGFDTLVKRWDKCINVGEGICREINVSFRFEYNMFYVLYPFVAYLLNLPRNLTTLLACNTKSLSV